MNTHPVSQVAADLLDFSEWLDTQGLLTRPSLADRRTHEDLVDEYLAPAELTAAEIEQRLVQALATATGRSVLEVRLAHGLVTA